MSWNCRNCGEKQSGCECKASDYALADLPNLMERVLVALLAKERAAHPAVEVLDALEASLMSRIEELSKPWGYSTGCTKVGIQEAVNNLRELRKAKGV